MLSTETKSRKQIRTISCDPGTVHFGVCHLAFYGFDYTQDEESKEWTKIPNFEILNWELWDLKRKISYGYDEERHCMVRNRYGSPSQGKPVEGIMNLAENLTEFIGTKEWVIESYTSTFYDNGETDVFPAVVTELQCGQIKNFEWDVFLVSHIFPWAIKSIHHTRNETREVISRARKYGFSNDGELTYDQRKAKAEEVTRALLKIVGMQKWITFLNALKAARKLDVPGKVPQAHDCADAFLLGLQYCIQEYEELEKKQPYSQDKEVPVIYKNIEITICDDSDDDEEDMKNVRKKQKKNPVIKLPGRESPSLVKLSDEMSEMFESMDKASKLKRKKSIKRKRDVIDEDEDDLSDEEVSIKKARKKPVKKKDNITDAVPIVKPKLPAKPRKKAEPKQKKMDVAKKYKQLQFVC